MTLEKRSKTLCKNPLYPNALLLPLKGEGALLWDENDKEYIDFTPIGKFLHSNKSHRRSITSN
jgi:acetylornithine/succinyldiaminopimelate/putrescine aminotransferase